MTHWNLLLLIRRLFSCVMVPVKLFKNSFHRAIMFKTKTRIWPIDAATSYILSLRDKPGFMERFIDINKGTRQHMTQLHF